MIPGEMGGVLRATAAGSINITGTLRIGWRLPRTAEVLSTAVRDAAQACDELGIDSIWIDTHVVVPADFESRHMRSATRPLSFNTRTPFPEPFSTLAFTAGVTRRVRLGTVVIPLMTTDPLTLAKQAATVDALSDGRLELGVGAGWLAEEAHILGRPFDHPSGRLLEAVDIMRTAWRDGVVEWHGRYYDFPPVGVAPQPPQRDRLPVWLGGTGEACVRIALERRAGLLLMQSTVEADASAARHARVREASLPLGTSLRLSGNSAEWLPAACELRDRGFDLIIVSGDGMLDEVAAIQTFAQEVLPALVNARLA